jgi:hypothetical protein
MLNRLRLKKEKTTKSKSEIIPITSQDVTDNSTTITRKLILDNSRWEASIYSFGKTGKISNERCC